VGSRTVVAIALAALLLLAGVVVWRYVRDPKMAAEATARGLQSQLGTAYRFRCTSEENDGSIGSGSEDVDYICEPERDNGPGYWVGTDGSRITGTVPMGP
jgi:hypothetical protein